MIFYHATSMDNLSSIMENGLKPGSDGLVYLTKDPKEALRFLAIRGAKEALVVKVSLSEERVMETFDHSYAFFKCRCFGYEGVIPVSKIKNYLKYEW